MKSVRIALWAMAALATIAVAWFSLAPGARTPGVASVAADYGAPFQATLVDAEGTKPIKRDDLLGRPHAMFFGFTHCPDVCPTTLYEASQWLKALGPEAETLDVYFVTVDPARDTAETMRDYLRPFDPRIRAITGTDAEIAALVKGWNVYAKKGPVEDGDYNVDHTASVFLMKPNGSLQGTVAYGESGDVALQKLRRLVRD